MEKNYRIIVRRERHYINTLPDDQALVVKFIRDNVIPRSALKVSFDTRGYARFENPSFPEAMQDEALIKEAERSGYTFSRECA